MNSGREKTLDVFLDKCLCIESIYKGKTPAWLSLQMKFEKVIAARMILSYNRAANKAIRQVANMVGRGSDINKIKKTLNKIMGNIFKKTEEEKIRKDIKKYYKKDRTQAIKDFKIKVIKKEKGEIDFDDLFSLEDTAIVDLVSAQNLIAAANLYKVGFSNHVISAINAIIKDSGLSRTQQKKKIEKELVRAMGLKKGKTDLKELVPKTFNGSTADYYTGLAETTLTRAQSMGRIELYKEADFSHYEIVIINDHRTSKICLSMDGRRFTLSDGVQQVDKILSAKSSDELKEVAGWRPNLSEFGLTDREGVNSAKVSKTLADAGMALPPYHFRCRSIIKPVF